ncbi:hypothetical protein AMTR_s00040p00030680 [Amborella trichopoda]|uniref:WAT1-related protein n=1 Tax=Amborella trichopoda TaxID=13333 RepID=W1PY39_AMBTC|nr:hypothetical protein AMTR_s00040p00030680 [Amborella trichopoda]
MTLFSKVALDVGMNQYVFVAYRQATATIFLAPFAYFLERVESVHIRSLRGLAKVIGVMVCMGGALIIALYKGPPLNQHHLTLGETHTVASHIDVASGRDWIKGTFLLLAANATWSLWLVLQGPLVMSCGSNLLLTTLQCLFSSLQSALVALALERSPNSWKLGWDLKLISVAYCV